MALSTRDKIEIGTKVLGARLWGRKIPLSVGWSITKRCNARCVYCGKWDDPNDDTPHDEAVSLCRQFVEAGTRIISLTGGEPLIRDDAGELIRLLKDGGIQVILATNGILVPDKLDVARQADRLNISVDGPRDVHDSFRGKGGFDQAIEATRAARSVGLPVVFATVLHARNVERINELLDLAKTMGCRINVQPIVQNPEAKADVTGSFPTVGAMQAAIRQLIAEKRRSGNRVVENSIPVLRHILNWPGGPSQRCESRVVSCRVEPDGHVHNCGRKKNRLPATSYREHGFLAAFRALPAYECSDCWCSSRYEINMLTSLNPLMVLNMLRRF